MGSLYIHAECNIAHDYLKTYAEQAIKMGLKYPIEIKVNNPSTSIH